MLVFSSGQHSGTGATASLELSTFNAPQGIRVSSITGEIWLANTNGRQLYRLPEFETLILTATPTTFPVTATIQTETSPFAVELDNSDNPVIAEQANRVTFYYALLAYQHPANYNSEPLAPGQLATLYRQGLGFNQGSQVDFTFAQPPGPPTPLPTNLGDIEVLVNGQAAFLYLLSPGTYSFVGFQVPSATPPSGTATIVVQHVSTGEIIGTVAAQMQQYNPGIFTSNGEGTGLVAATNNGGATINSPANPIPVGGNNFITFYLTGLGPIPGVADGVANPGVTGPVTPTIIAGNFAGGEAPSKEIIFAGSSFFPGLWQINFQVDSSWAPGCGASQIFVVQVGGTPSSIGPSGQPGSAQVYFCVSSK
jgi:uncharacterized protein (TIGR03437 family)